MNARAFAHSLRRLWALDPFVYSLRVFIALASIMGGCAATQNMALVTPLYLGVIASALAETDDNWRGRLRAQLVTLLCFGAAAFLVKAVFPYPWLFAAGLALSSFWLTMLGAVGERYRAVGWATLILFLYTTIGLEQRVNDSGVFWLEPALLLAGATWYGVLSVLWSAVFPHQPVQQNLARLFQELGSYLRLKSALFEPLRGVDVADKRVALARQNGRVVQALNATKESLFNRIGPRPGRTLNRYLRLYFIAQDVHERASSSHYPYNDLADTFFHSDVMFRCQRVLSIQARTCLDLARATRLRQPFEPGDDAAQAVDDLQASIAYLHAQQRPDWQRPLRTLGAVSGNLSTLARQLAGAHAPETPDERPDSALLDRSPQSLREAWDRIRLQLTPASPLFRHALRLSIALLAGYGLLHLIHANQGYWIVLTTLFVCQPNYGATTTRMTQRILGTIFGLLAGWIVFRLFPHALPQSMFAVAAAVVFIATRATRYTLATAAITLQILLSFNQIGDGYGLIMPRMVDTLLGSLIAGLAVFTILPDWRGRRLSKVAALAIANSSRYLREIMAQYETGKRDDLAYRLARRNAHNADAALSTAIANILKEPGHFRRDAEIGLRFLVLSHTLLNYLSALGAHRGTLPDAASDTLMTETAAHVTQALDEIARSLANKQPVPLPGPDEGALATALENQPDDLDDGHRLVQTELALISRQLGSMRETADKLLTREAQLAT